MPRPWLTPALSTRMTRKRRSRQPSFHAAAAGPFPPSRQQTSCCSAPPCPFEPSKVRLSAARRGPSLYRGRDVLHGEARAERRLPIGGPILCSNGKLVVVTTSPCSLDLRPSSVRISFRSTVPT